jgi:hypothetical protein
MVSVAVVVRVMRSWGYDIMSKVKRNKKMGVEMPAKQVVKPLVEVECATTTTLTGAIDASVPVGDTTVVLDLEHEGAIENIPSIAVSLEDKGVLSSISDDEHTLTTTKEEVAKDATRKKGKKEKEPESEYERRSCPYCHGEGYIDIKKKEDVRWKCGFCGAGRKKEVKGIEMCFCCNSPC